jgi:hypothetical protein
MGVLASCAPAKAVEGPIRPAPPAAPNRAADVRNFRFDEFMVRRLA